MSVVGDGGRDTRADDLPCGRDPLDVVDRARAGRSSEHERTCPYCQGVIAAEQPATRAVAALAASERDSTAPDTLLPDVMRSVWSDMRRASMIPLRIDLDRSTAFIADHAVAALVENALDEIGNLQIHTCSITLESGLDPLLAVTVTAAAAYVSNVRGVADEARAVVRHTISEQLGWLTGDIDIDIVDVFQAHEARPQVGSGS